MTLVLYRDCREIRENMQMHAHTYTHILICTYKHSYSSSVESDVLLEKAKLVTGLSYLVL